jgi:hypothetical protein
MKRALLVVLAFASPAHAQEFSPPQVPPDKQKQAEELFAEGNELFAREAHAPALEKYKAAVDLWDHPLIRFNMAVTEIRLDRILEAADDLEAALRYGQAPFTRELYKQAMDYQKLLSGRVGYVEASCEQAGGSVLLDGKPWFKCAGERKLRVLAGEHSIVAQAEGYMTLSRPVVVAGEKTVSEKLVLVPIDTVVKLEYPSPRWMPWTVVGIGGAVALGGVAFYVAGQTQLTKLDQDYAAMCPTGCTDDIARRDQLLEAQDSAFLKGKIALAMEIGGGAIAGAGVVWVILNRPKRVLPMGISPTTGGMTARVTWRF